MSTACVITDKYSKAAFNVAKKTNAVEQFLSDLQIFADNISDGFIKELSNPTISKNDLVSIISELSKKLSIGENVTSFLSTIADARRIALFKQIHEKFIKLSEIDKKILKVDLLVANDLEQNQLLVIEDLLKQKYFDNTIKTNQIIKKEILGGVIIKIGSTMIDSSLRNKLSAIKNEFNSIIN